MNSIISENQLNENGIQSYSDTFFKENNISKLLKKSNFYKDNGVSCSIILKFIISLIFTGKNLYSLLETKNSLPFSKDTVYRFLNSCSYNWRRFLLLLASNIIKNVINPLTSDDRVNVLIIDDSIFSRNRSKAIELLARVFDHANNRWIKGFRMLTLGWSDGNTFIPLAFSLLSSRKDKNRINGINKNIDKRTNGYKRRREALKKSTKVMINLLKQAVKFNLPTDYVLFDSWFAFPANILEVLELKLHTICMIKAMPKVYYTYKGKKMNLKTLYAKAKKNFTKSDILGSIIVSIGKDADGNEVFAKIVFVRDDNKRKWLALLSTDTQLSDKEIVRIYGKRWDIEVFFKMSKSYLRLAKEFQGLSYDMMTAHTTIVFIRYIMLAVEKRRSEDDRSWSNLFYYLCDELKDIEFAESFSLILELLKQALKNVLLLAEKKINELLGYFFNALPSHIKRRLQIFVCEG